MSIKIAYTKNVREISSLTFLLRSSKTFNFLEFDKLKQCAGRTSNFTKLYHKFFLVHFANLFKRTLFKHL